MSKIINILLCASAAALLFFTTTIFAQNGDSHKAFLPVKEEMSVYSTSVGILGIPLGGGLKVET